MTSNKDIYTPINVDDIANHAVPTPAICALNRMLVRESLGFAVPGARTSRRADLTAVRKLNYTCIDKKKYARHV